MPLNLKDQDDSNETYLLYEIARQVVMVYDRRAQPLKLTRAQWRLLSILRRNPGIRQNQVAEQLEIEPITLVRHLDRMEKAGWVKRQPDPKDRRANQLFLTDKVSSIVSQMRDLGLTLRQEALAGFSAVEHQQFLSYLTRMKSNMANLMADRKE